MANLTNISLAETTAKNKLDAGTEELNNTTDDAFRPVLNVWRPVNEPPVVLLRWFMTEWCNYQCPYCPQTHDRRAAKGHGFTSHAFDNFPLEQWLSAFERHFTNQRLSIVITGGEPFVDRHSMLPLLDFLTRRITAVCIRIDTNAWWNPDQYAGLDKSKITLMCTFHPSQISASRFFAKIEALMQAGFRIGMVNYVMTAENLATYSEFKEALRSKNIPLHPNPLWGAGNTYSPQDLEVLRLELPDIDFRYRTGRCSPKGARCLFPSLAYELDYKGLVHVGCHRERFGSFFDPALPDLPVQAVPCPHESCVCLDKYSFLEESNRNTGLDPLRIYGDVLRTNRGLCPL